MKLSYADARRPEARDHVAQRPVGCVTSGPRGVEVPLIQVGPHVGR